MKKKKFLYGMLLGLSVLCMASGVACGDKTQSESSSEQEGFSEEYTFTAVLGETFNTP